MNTVFIAPVSKNGMTQYAVMLSGEGFLLDSGSFQLPSERDRYAYGVRLFASREEVRRFCANRYLIRSSDTHELSELTS